MTHWHPQKFGALWVSLINSTDDVAQIVQNVAKCLDPNGEKIIRPVVGVTPDAKWEWEVVARDSAFAIIPGFVATEKPEPYPEPEELAEKVQHRDNFPRYSNYKFQIAGYLLLFIFYTVTILLLEHYFSSK